MTQSALLWQSIKNYLCQSKRSHDRIGQLDIYFLKRKGRLYRRYLNRVTNNIDNYHEWDGTINFTDPEFLSLNLVGPFIVKFC